MKRKLFMELRSLYATSKEGPHDIRIRIRMRDLIDPNVLRHAVDTTMQRYPYFCVELEKTDGRYYFADNHRPVVVTNSLHGVELNCAESNYHMIAFSWQDNLIVMDVFHGMTDGTGAYEIIRTLLYYYCCQRYIVTLNEDGIRLVGDDITMEEWVDPVENRTDLPMPPRVEISNALNLINCAGLENDNRHTVYSIAIDESEFMKFNIDNDGSPGTMIALLLSRAIAQLYPEAKDVIRVALCVNQRKALHVPLAHQSLVGVAMLEYKDKMRDWPIEKQATAYRGMVFAQTQDENVLTGVSSFANIIRMMESKESEQERIAAAKYMNNLAGRVVTATVSYVGKAHFKQAERYIRDFRLWTSPAATGLLIEISAVNGRFTLDVLQTFSNPIFVSAFLKELDANGIVYDMQDVHELELSNIRLPWTE